MGRPYVPVRDKERHLATGTTVSASYLYSKGMDLPFFRDINFNPADSTLHLRNNVVVNHPSAIVPEPTAYHSILDNLVRVRSSNNMAFASALMSNIEQQDGPQNISNFDHVDFFQRNRQAAALAFIQTRWTTQPAANPNWNLFRLRNDGPLHEGGSVTGLIIRDGEPDALDIPVTDDIEKDARPSNHGGVSHTDRGPDQFRPLTAGDITMDLRPRLPGLLR